MLALESMSLFHRKMGSIMFLSVFVALSAVLFTVVAASPPSPNHPRKQQQLSLRSSLFDISCSHDFMMMIIIRILVIIDVYHYSAYHRGHHATVRGPDFDDDDYFGEEVILLQQQQ